MTLSQLLARQKAELDKLTTQREDKAREVEAARATLTDDATIDVIDTAEKRAREARAGIADIDAQIAERRSAVEALQGEVDDEARITEATKRTSPTNAPRPSYDEQVRTGAEQRTYSPHQERGFDSRTGQLRAGTRAGAQFEWDVAAAFLGDYEARQRLERHMQEERVERGQQLTRAVGTGAFAGLTVPQYLTDLYAPATAARRPFADAIRGHALPPSGMTVNLSRITTATSAALQAAENDAVSDTDIDDTLLTINVQTNAGQQTLSRQAIERGTGVEAVVLDDLFRRYATTLDNTLINQATNGLVNVATTVTYTDASPTAAELYPKVLEALSGVEAALLDQASGENIAVMHSRRWYWMQSQVGTSWPFVSQPGIPAQMGAVNNAVSYGAGQRGILPNGTPVIVDNNIATNLGAGTNEDRVFLVDRNECHLWEDPSAPMFIRAEQTKAANLGVLLVVYGYFAYTHARYAQARQIGGTGLVAPTF